MARGDYYSGVGLGGLNAGRANPFQSVVQSDPWAGLRQAGQLPMSPLGAPQGMPTSQVPAYSPLTDPTGPLARAGWIGSLLATGPTKQEHLAAKLGQGQQAALAGIGTRMQAGMSPQRAILDFANSPEGADFFVNGGGFTDLANVAKGLTPPVTEGVLASPGQQMLNPMTGGVMASVPVTEVQKFNAMADLAGMTDEEKKQAAQAQVMKDQAGDLSATEAAMSRLVAQGRIKQETADLILSGAIKPQAILDEAGKTIGYGVFDLSTGNFTQLPTVGQAPGQLPTPQSKDYAPGVTPGTEPDKQDDNGPKFEGMTNPADIVDAAGPIGWLTERLGPLYGNYDPANAPNETIQKRSALGRIMADASALARDGRLLKAEAEDIRKLSDTLGFMQSPATTATKLISLHDAYDNAEKVLNQTIQNPKSTAKNIGDARIELSNIRRAKANLPTRESLIAKREALGAQAPGEALTEQLTEGEDLAAKNGLTAPAAGAKGAEPQPAQVPEFKSMTDLNAAFEKGTVKIGDSVILNGQRMKLAPPGSKK